MSKAIDNNNPGNIKDPKTGEFMKFSSPEEGYAALMNDLQGKFTGATSTGLHGGSSLMDFAQVYAPASDNNNPGEYTAKLANQLGVSPDTKLSDLQDKIPQMAYAIANNEDVDFAKKFPIDFGKGGGQTPQTPAATPAQDNTPWWQSAIQDIASPFLKMGASAYLVGEAAGGLPKEDIQKQEESGFNLGFLGNVKPIAGEAMAEYDKGKIGSGEELTRSAEDIVSTGANIASWFVGVGEEKASAEVGADVTKSIFPKIWQSAKNAIPFSAMQALSAGTGELAKGKDALTATKTAAENFAGNVAGFIALDGAGGLVKRRGAKMLQSTIVKAANESFLKMMDELVKPAFEGAQNVAGKAGDKLQEMLEHPSIMEEFKNNFLEAHKKLSDGTADVLKTGLDYVKGWADFASQVGENVDKKFVEAEDLFKQAYANMPSFGGDAFSKTKELLDRKGLLGETAGEGKIKDLLSKTKETAAKKLAGEKVSASEEKKITAEFRKKLGLDEGSFEYTISKLNDLVQNGTKAGGKSVQELLDTLKATSAKVDEGQGSILNQFIGVLSKDIRATLKDSNPTLATTLDSAFNKAQEAYTAGYGKFNAFRDLSANAEKVLEDFAKTGKSSDADNKALLKLLGGQSSDLRKQFSEMIYNRMIDLTKSMEPNDAGKMIDNFLSNFKYSKLVNPEHLNDLRHFSQLLNNTADHFLDSLGFIGAKETKKMATQAIGLEEKAKSYKFISSLMDNLSGESGVIKNADGTFDMTGIIFAISKAGEGVQKQDAKQYQKVLDMVTKMNTMNPKEVEGKMAKSFVDTALGTFLLSTGHTWWGASMTSRGLSAIVSSEGAVSGKEASKMASALIDKVKPDGKPYIDNKFLKLLFSDKYKEARQATDYLKKSLSEWEQGNQNKD